MKRIRTRPASGLSTLLLSLLLSLLLTLLAACGGGGGEGDGASGAECSPYQQNTALRSYMDDWYFWNTLSPKPLPIGFSTVDRYFRALLYTGSSAEFPADRWSGYQSTEAFERLFSDGESLGYGLSVAGLEVTGRPLQPLFVRHVEPLSDAAAQGVQRGDQVISLNGRAASDLIAANDFSALTPGQVGERLTVRLRSAGVERTLSLAATVYALTPVLPAQVMSTPGGHKIGYVFVKDMINQAMTPFEAAFSQFKAAGVQDVVIDLRYNGGGLVQVGTNMASFVTGTRARGQIYATLRYNSRHLASNTDFLLSNPASALEGLQRVYVLTGQRTCSASEQVINGLKPFVDVVVIGDTSCGKPVGFVPTSRCGTTFSVVNFESVNSRGEGRYFDGIKPRCAVAEDLSRPLGAADEPLLAAAARHVDSGSCAPLAGGREAPQARGRSSHPGSEPGDWQGMIVR